VNNPAVRRAPRWRWGSCPRCGADAWLEIEYPGSAACSRECRYSIWDWLESSYRWELRFGEVFGLRSFDDRGRPGAGEASLP
jgi:hypothetical protein